MEWVETTGRTVEEAKEYALDQLGVDEADAEFEVVEEPKLGLFGRLRTEARVRARVRPQAPPPKLDRRDRRRGRKRDGDAPGAPDGDAPGAPDGEAAGASAERDDEQPQRDETRRARPPRQPRAGRSRRRDEGDDVNEPRDRDRERPVPTQADIDDQSTGVRAFLDGLLDAFGVDAQVEVGVTEDGALEARIEGADVGLLIGPRAQTLDALQELARRALQQHAEDSMRLRVDVGGYRERRREALGRFAKKVADQVLETGEAASLEPMGAADRKVVHDTVNEIAGVRTTSEGEEPRRRVVVLPE